MKKKLFLGFSLAIFAAIICISTGFAINHSSDVSNVVVEEALMAPPPACPNSPSTIQGCLIDVNGCTYMQTTNGRTIAVSVFGFPVGVGDNVSLTGNWQTDADCAPCVLNAFSVTDLGDC